MTKTAHEIRKELAAKNSEARALRRALKEAEKAELLSAKTALGEALATVVFADSADAMQALIQTLNEPAIADNLRRILGVNNTENDAAKEPEGEALWASPEGDDQPGSDDATASFCQVLGTEGRTERAQVRPQSPPSESAMTFGALAKNVLWRKSIDCLGGEAGTRAVK